MKLIRSLYLNLASLLVLAAAVTVPVAIASPAPDPGQISISVGRLLEQGHYTRHKLDNEISHRLLQNYLEALDYNHLFFTQQDVDAFEAKYGAVLGDDILLGTPDPAVEMFDIYKKRVEDRVAKVKQWIAAEKFDFKSDRSVALNRQKAAWPKDEAEADQLWHDRVEYELLQEKLSQHSNPPAKGGHQPVVAGKDSPAKITAHRYDRIVLNLHEETHQDAVDIFLSCLAQTYDPHSEYLSKSESDNFKISMGLSLVGIGAVLHSDDGYAKIMELVTGGPAHKDGRLKVGDRIAGVAQGDAEFVDTIDMKLDKVVSMIRGQKDTKVRLLVIPAHAADPSVRKIIDIVRDQVKLKDSQAKAEIVEKPDAHGNPERLGWITLPSFYADMDHAFQKDAKSTTKDVQALIARLQKENITGLVIDLRRNGGGSLDEAIKLTHLFVKNGPVVQVKDANGKIQVLTDDKDTPVVYNGPLIVLINSLSASASEIFAGALQDYGRALIVGDHHTFGKGTVQTMLDISRFIPFSGGSDGEAGQLKLTIQKFYRIAGGSTQLHGVDSDIVLPSLYDHDDIGEGALKGPMPYDTVEPADFEKVTDHPLFVDQLRARSTTRVAADPEFKFVIDDLAKLKEKLAENRISLNEQVRRAEIAKEKTLKETRLAERAKRHTPEPTVYAVTLDNIDKPELELAKNDLTKDDASKPDAAKTDGRSPQKTVENSHVDKNGVKAPTDKSDVKSAKPTIAKGKKAPIHKDEKKADSSKGPDDNVTADPEDDADDLDNPDTEKGAKIDPVRTETLNILSDLVELENSQKTASVVK